MRAVENRCDSGAEEKPDPAGDSRLNSVAGLAFWEEALGPGGFGAHDDFFRA